MTTNFFEICLCLFLNHPVTWTILKTYHNKARPNFNFFFFRDVLIQPCAIVPKMSIFLVSHFSFYIVALEFGCVCIKENFYLFIRFSKNSIGVSYTVCIQKLEIWWLSNHYYGLTRSDDIAEIICRFLGETFVGMPSLFFDRRWYELYQGTILNVRFLNQIVCRNKFLSRDFFATYRLVSRLRWGILEYTWRRRAASKWRVRVYSQEKKFT